MSELFPERIETNRLELAAMGPDTVDVMRFYRICSGQEAKAMDEITEYVPWDPHSHPKETLEFLEDAAQGRADGESAQYVIRPKDGEEGAGEIAGATGLGVDWDRRTGTLGMWLRKPFWGRGYSGERAAALMEVAFERLDLELVAVTHEVGNDKSRRAIEKYVEAHGGSHDGLLRNWDGTRGDPRDLHRYTVSAEEYEEATASD